MADLATINKFRERVMLAEKKMHERDGVMVGKESEALCPVNHSWGDGCYIREWTCPPGVLTISKIHKIAHPFFVLEGDVSVMTEDGVERIKAPHHGITQPGTKRILYTHTKTRWVTVHVTDQTDVDEIEKEIIAKDFNDLKITEADMAKLLEETI
jgi:hypothetical protein